MFKPIFEIIVHQYRNIFDRNNEKTIMKPTINHTISLGPFCFNAMFMKKKMYKNASFPFDWLFSNLKMINDCLENDFDTFMDKSKHKKISSKASEHTEYKIHKMFNHHDITSRKDYDYFSRCIARFRNLHKTKGTKLFTAIILSSSLNDAQSNLIKSIHKNLKRYAGEDHVLLIVCINVVGKKEDKKRYSVDKWFDDLYVVNLRTHEKLNGMSFVDRKDHTLYDKMLHELFTFEIINPRNDPMYT